MDDTRTSKSAPRVFQEEKKAICNVHVGRMWLQVVVVRRSWEAGGRGKERVNLSDIGHPGLLI